MSLLFLCGRNQIHHFSRIKKISTQKFDSIAFNKAWRRENHAWRLEKSLNQREKSGECAENQWKGRTSFLGREILPLRHGGHSHGPILVDKAGKSKEEMEKEQELANRVTWIGLGSNVLMAVSKLIAGIVGHSAALVADAIHSVSDLVSDFVTLGALKIARRPPNPSFPYGFGKFESVGAVAVSAILIATGVGTAMHAMEHFHTPETPTSIALWVSLISIVSKELLFQWTVRIGKRQKSSLLIANAWHHRTDAISSLVALVGIIGSQAGYHWLDPLAGVAVAGLIVKVGIESSWEGLKELVDASTDPELEQEAKKIALAVEGVNEVKSLKSRKLGPNVSVEMVLKMDGHLTLDDAFHIRQHVEFDLKDKIPRISNAIVELEPNVIADEHHHDHEQKNS